MRLQENGRRISAGLPLPQGMLLAFCAFQFYGGARLFRRRHTSDGYAAIQPRSVRWSVRRGVHSSSGRHCYIDDGYEPSLSGRGLGVRSRDEVTGVSLEYSWSFLPSFNNRLVRRFPPPAL